MSIDVNKESSDFEVWHEQQLRENADYINGSEKHRAWMAWFARAIAGAALPQVSAIRQSSNQRDEKE